MCNEKAGSWAHVPSLLALATPLLASSLHSSPSTLPGGRNELAEEMRVQEGGAGAQSWLEERGLGAGEASPCLP